MTSQWRRFWFIYIWWVLWDEIKLVCFCVVADPKNYLQSCFILLLCDQCIVFSHITTNSCYILSILHPVLMIMRWFYQSILIASPLRFGVTLKNTDMQWSLFKWLNISWRHVCQNGWFYLNVKPVKYLLQIYTTYNVNSNDIQHSMLAHPYFFGFWADIQC